MRAYGSDETRFTQTDMSPIANHDVIDDANAEYLASAYKAARELVIIRARRWISARVIVGDDDRGRVCEERSLEDLARLCCGRSYVG